MGISTSLDDKINRLGFWSAIVVIVTAVISVFLPLDAPGGYTAEHADRVTWLSNNREIFIAAWVNQIVAMLSLSAVFFAIAWRIGSTNPLRAILAAMVVLMSVMAFIIPKFIAVWTIPLLADTIATGAVGAELADPLLRILNVSVPFSLYTSFDYLGFWLYSVFALLVAMPLFGPTLATKISSVCLALFGIIYQLALLTLWAGKTAATDIEGSFLGTSLLLVIAIIAMAIQFKQTLSSEK
ncbi:MAG: hypothetical protein QF884_05255 [Porticoccaceae bacterium]|jgi:hypothetical protein|nr:hypothetical protein [Porticoccaceae bacterium]